MAKVMISLPDDLLRRLDAEARRRSMTRSGLLAATILEALARRDVDSVRKAVARSRERFAGEDAFEAAELVRADRDDRRW